MLIPAAIQACFVSAMVQIAPGADAGSGRARCEVAASRNGITSMAGIDAYLVDATLGNMHLIVQSPVTNPAIIEVAPGEQVRFGVVFNYQESWVNSGCRPWTSYFASGPGRVRPSDG